MTTEAKLSSGSHGLLPENGGWFVVNVADSLWRSNPQFGSFCAFEGKERFKQFGINIHILEPGKPGCMYHSESEQESFLILHGECLLIIEGQERSLKAWDFVHCPAGTRHVFVGAGEAVCAVLMVGSRKEGSTLLYPSDETAAKYKASVDADTADPKEAYAGCPRSEETPASWPLT